jgi:hypothetical protein
LTQIVDHVSHVDRSVRDRHAEHTEQVRGNWPPPQTLEAKGWALRPEPDVRGIEASRVGGGPGRVHPSCGWAPARIGERRLPPGLSKAQGR